MNHGVILKYEHFVREQHSSLNDNGIVDKPNASFITNYIALKIYTQQNPNIFINHFVFTLSIVVVVFYP